jgi:hypothetical protein
MKTYLQASSLGNYVKESLLNGSEGKVMGITSKGIFLLFGKKSVFLTYNDHYSPFNIVLPVESVLPDDLVVGDVVYFSQDELLIPTCELTISLHNTQVWIPASPLSIVNSELAQIQNSQNLLAEIFKIGPEKGFFFLTHSVDQDTASQSKIRQSTQLFAQAFHSNHLTDCLAAADQLLGLGSGLTPSGDDWITGYILYHARMDLAKKQSVLPFIASLGAELTFSAYQKTTCISANRLDAAQKGWSEAFFLSAIDYLFNTSSSNPQELADKIYQFGHSSGVDTFIGITAACIAAKEFSIKA